MPPIRICKRLAKRAAVVAMGVALACGALPASAPASDLAAGRSSAIAPSGAVLEPEGRPESDLGQPGAFASLGTGLSALPKLAVANAASPLEGAAYAVLTEEGDLVFFRSNDAYGDGSAQAVSDIAGNAYSGKVYASFETRLVINRTDKVPWNADRASIRTVSIAEGQTIRPFTCKWWFYSLPNLTDIDLTGLDTSLATDLSLMFSSMSGSITELDVTGFDTSNATDMSWMFYNCSGLGGLDVSGFDTSGVTNMSYMFANMSSVRELDLSNFDTSNVTAMGNMFNGCNLMTSLDLSSFDTSKVKNMISMFHNCRSLTALDLSHFDTPNVADLSWMFRRCYSLEAIDLSSFDTSNVVTFERMFDECSNLAFLDLSGFDTSRATTMSYMFLTCPKLAAVSLGEAFTFQGNGAMTCSAAQVCLPTPASNDGTHNGRWTTPTAGATPQYTPTALRDAYHGPTMAGTYVWAVSSNNVSFDANGGSGLMQPGKVNVGEGYAVPECGFSHEGLVFDGWNTEADGSGRGYAPGETLVPASDVVLYAQWVEPRVVLDITGAVLVDMAPDGSLSCPEGQSVSMANRGNVDVRLVGVTSSPAPGLSFAAQPAGLGDMDVWLAFDNGSTVAFSDCLADELPLSPPSEWVIARGGEMRVADIGGVVGGIDLRPGVSRFTAGTVTWRFAVWDS